MAYGVTNSGKTYLMGALDQCKDGLIPSTIKMIFSEEISKQYKFKISAYSCLGTNDFFSFTRE
jgi:hypothetical protein